MVPFQTATNNQAAFLLLIGWIVLMHFLQGRTADSVLTGVFFALAVLLCVLLHEYGHALAARRFGTGTRDITLLPIGGVARLERMPEGAQTGAAGGAGRTGGQLRHIRGALPGAAGCRRASAARRTERDGVPFLERLMVANILLALFNMLPAFPMDGGRVLRALLATRPPHARATRIAAFLGQGMALLFGLAGLFGNPNLLFIGGYYEKTKLRLNKNDGWHIPAASILKPVPIGSGGTDHEAGSESRAVAPDGGGSTPTRPPALLRSV